MPASLRRTNQRTVISLLFLLGRASRADLAKAAGFSQPTAGKIIVELTEQGILQAAAERRGADGEDLPPGSRRLGRPGQLLTLDRDHPRFLAIELGVLETRVAALPVGVRPTDEWTTRFPTPTGPNQWLAALDRACAAIPRKGLRGVLVSVPGIVDETAGRILFCPNLHWLEMAALPELLRGLLGLPVILVQEIRALARGQLMAEPEADNFLLVDFGEGVGGAIVLEGKLYSPSTPLSGELGHTPVPGNRRLCGCGGRGCLETLASQRGLLESFAASKRGRPRSWKLLTRTVAERGLEPWLEETLDATAQVIAGALNVLGLRRTIVTGTLSQFPAPIFEHLASAVRKLALAARFGEVSCSSETRRRMTGLVAAGLDRLLLPAYDEVESHPRSLRRPGLLPAKSD